MQGLRVGPANDRYEQEADRVARQVVSRVQTPPVQREGAAEEELQMKPLTPTVTPLQRKTFQKPVQRAVNHGVEGGEVEAGVAQQIQRAGGGGKPLDEKVRGQMERGFGADFSGVRVHTGAQADTLNRSLNARAFTTGKDIFFKRGEYNPGSSAGKELLAHELTHTVQQGAAGVQRTVTRGSKALFHPTQEKQVVRRTLSVDDTDWSKTRTVTSITADAKGGVLVFHGGGKSKIAVKPGETRIAENLIVGNLGKQLSGTENKEKKKEWKFQTPDVRLVASPIEAEQIEMTANEKLDPSLKQHEKTQTLIAKSGSAGSLVMSFMSGESMDKLSVKDRMKKNEFDPTHIFNQFVLDETLLVALGRATAMDIYMGNGDRIMKYFAPQNILVNQKKKQLNLIDNVMDEKEANFDCSDLKGLQHWLTQEFYAPFIQGKYEQVWTRAWTNMQNSIHPEKKGSFGEETDKILRERFISGLIQGKERLMIALQNPEQLVTGVPEKERQSALIAVWARRLALTQGDVANAVVLLEQANEMAGLEGGMNWQSHSGTGVRHQKLKLGSKKNNKK